MPIVKCNDCDGPVDDHVWTCPRCGAPVKTVAKGLKTSRLAQFVINLIVIALVCIGGWGLLHRLMK